MGQKALLKFIILIIAMSQTLSARIRESEKLKTKRLLAGEVVMRPWNCRNSGVTICILQLQRRSAQDVG